MAAELLLPTARATDTNSNPYSGAQWFFYESGTLTPQAVFANATLATSLGAVVTADSAGKFVPIYFDATLAYRGICKNASGSVTLHDIDPINTNTMGQFGAPGGSTLVGFLQAGTGAVARTAQAKMREVLTPYDFGAVGDGTADDTSKLQAAVTAAIAQERVLDLAYGTYRVTGQINGTGPAIRITNTGGARIVAEEGTYTDAVIKLYGAATQIEALNASVSKGALAFEQVTSSSFDEGDWGTFYDPTDYSFAEFTGGTSGGQDRPTYRKGEFFEVREVSGTDVTARSPLYDTYGSGDTDVYKVSPITGYVRDIWIESEVIANWTLLKIDYGRDFEVARPKLRGTGLSGIVMSRCLRHTIASPDVICKGKGGVSDDDYGISESSCQHGRIVGGRTYGRRHGVSRGNSDQSSAVPCRDCLGIGGLIVDNDRASGVHCADSHGNSEGCGFENCLIFGGASISGIGTVLRGNHIHSMSNGVCVVGYEIIGGRHDVTDNTLECHTDPGSTGIIDIPSAGTGMAKDFVLNVRGNKFVSIALGAGSRLVRMQNDGSTSYIDVIVANNDMASLNNFGTALYMRLLSGTAASRGIVVERNITGLTGKFSMLDGGTGGSVNAYANLAVLRMPEERWSQTVNTATGIAAINASAKTFKWIYPRAPVVTVSKGTSTDSATPEYTALSATGVTPRLNNGGTNFSVAETVTLPAHAGISE